MSTFFWLGLWLIQRVYSAGIRPRLFGDALIQFQDLLSLANVSLFVLGDRNCGYYMHGRAVHAHSDAPMLELNQNLKKEEDNLTTTRGLLPNSIQQCFEMHITQKLRDQLDNVYLYMLAHDGLVNSSPLPQVCTFHHWGFELVVVSYNLASPGTNAHANLEPTAAVTKEQSAR